MKRTSDVWAKLLGVLIVSAAAWPLAGYTQVHGVISEVLDGDTVTIEADGHSFRLSLAGIDAPEPEQPLSDESRQSLGELCYGRAVSIEEIEIDRRRRIVGHVECDGIDAVAEQVRRGFARVLDNAPDADPSLYALQAEARQAGRGMWATP